MNIENLKLWERPEHYFGADWPEYFCFLGQSRESSTLERSNFICGLEALGGESETVLVIRESHWAVGWVEWIGIHGSDAKALAIADKIAGKLEGYPVVNEDHWSALEYEEAAEFWKSLGVRGRLEMLEGSGISIFAARRDWLPEDPNGYPFERLTCA